MLRLMQTDLIDIGHMNSGRWQRIAEINWKMAPIRSSTLTIFYTTKRVDRLMNNYLRIIAAISLLVMVLLLLTGWYFRLNRRLRVEIHARREAETSCARYRRRMH